MIGEKKTIHSTLKRTKIIRNNIEIIKNKKMQ